MTLTEAAEFTKKGVYIVGIPFIVILVGWMVIGMLTDTEDLPENYLTPDYMCGKLQTIELDSLQVETTDTEFNIETTSGAVPDLPEIVNVFKYEYKPSLLAIEEAKIIAEKLEFEPNDYQRKSASEYTWEDRSNARTLTIETGNLNFTLETDFASSSVDTNSSTLPSEENAKQIAMQYLQNRSFLTKDYANGEQRTYAVQITLNGEMREAPSISEADLIRVDFFRKKDLITIDPELVGSSELGSTLQEQLAEEETSTISTEDDSSKEVKQYVTDVVTDNPLFGNISVYVGGKEPGEYSNEYQIFRVDYTNWIIGDLACGTYRLISPQEAVQKVQDGEATLVHLMEKNGDRISPYESKPVKEMTILEVDLNYLDRSEKQFYMQPIFTIRGEAEFDTGEYGEFYYYVPAIDYSAIPEDAGQQQVEEETEEEDSGGGFIDPM